MSPTSCLWVVHYSGRVQGVGFRYHTLQIAKEFEVSGYVKNLADGRVLVEAEGETGQVESFCNELESRLSFFIRKVEKEKLASSGRHKGFTIN